MNSWCESCARKGCCYTMEMRPRCYIATTNTASGTPESYLAKSLRYSRDSHEIATTEPNSSEKPNNCEHITEDGVTCAKYPACDDCLDNPLNKVKGSERLVKGSEQTDCQTCKWWSSYGYCVHRECKGYEPQTEREGE